MSATGVHTTVPGIFKYYMKNSLTLTKYLNQMIFNLDCEVGLVIRLWSVRTYFFYSLIETNNTTIRVNTPNRTDRLFFSLCCSRYFVFGLVSFNTVVKQFNWWVFVKYRWYYFLDSRVLFSVCFPISSFNIIFSLLGTIRIFFLSRDQTSQYRNASSINIHHNFVY